eukprot:SAG11_NODE_283_length_11241_cov_8.234428_8_plen_104_part_00
MTAISVKTNRLDNNPAFSLSSLDPLGQLTANVVLGQNLETEIFSHGDKPATVQFGAVAANDGTLTGSKVDHRHNTGIIVGLQWLSISHYANFLRSSSSKWGRR